MKARSREGPESGAKTWKTTQPPPSRPGDALLALMVAVSESDDRFEMSELNSIRRIMRSLPIFNDYDERRIGYVSKTVSMLTEETGGIEALFGLVGPALPSELAETAYVLACEVAVADGRIGNREFDFLGGIKDNLGIDPLVAAAIHRTVRARHASL